MWYCDLSRSGAGREHRQRAGRVRSSPPWVRWRPGGRIERAVGRRTEGEHVGVECVVARSGLEVGEGGGGERVRGAGEAV